MSDTVGATARAVADRLLSQYGPGLAADVEAALHARTSKPRADQYFDPASLGSMIVSVATLGWTIYRDLKKKSPSPAPDQLARTIRVELRSHGDVAPVPQRSLNEITEITVNEITRAAGDS